MEAKPQEKSNQENPRQARAFVRETKGLPTLEEIGRGTGIIGEGQAGLADLMRVYFALAMG